MNRNSKRTDTDLQFYKCFLLSLLINVPFLNVKVFISLKKTKNKYCTDPNFRTLVYFHVEYPVSSEIPTL